MRAAGTYDGLGANLGGVLADELAALAEPVAELLDEVAGDCDRSMTVAEGSSESEERPERAFLAGNRKGGTSFCGGFPKQTFILFSLRALRSAIRLRILCFKDSGGVAYASVALALSAAVCHISDRRVKTRAQYFAVPRGLRRNGLSNHSLTLLG